MPPGGLLEAIEAFHARGVTDGLPVAATTNAREEVQDLADKVFDEIVRRLTG